MKSNIEFDPDEILKEMDELNNIGYITERKIYVNQEDNISISVDGPGRSGRYFFVDPYFKINDDLSRGQGGGTKSARIYFARPEYVRNHADGKDNWKLSSAEKRNLNRYIRDINHTGTQVWYSMLEELKIAYKNNKNPKDILRMDIFNNPIPDYTLLH